MMTGRRVGIIDLAYQGQINDVKALIEAGCDVRKKLCRRLRSSSCSRKK